MKAKLIELLQGLSKLLGRQRPLAYDPDDGPLNDQQLAQIQEIAGQDIPKGKLLNSQSLF
jgi:hypothetical protein